MSDKPNSGNPEEWKPKPITKEAFDRIMKASKKREEWLKKAHTLDDKHLKMRIDC